MHADAIIADPERERVLRFRDSALPHLSHAYALARAIMGNKADAEDAVQTCYLLALRHFDTLIGPDIKPWLFHILRNVCHTEYRLRQYRPMQTGVQETMPDIAEAMWQQLPATPESEIIRNEEATRMQLLVAALPSHLREVLELREYGALSYREIAKVLELPAGTVMSRLSRARETLSCAWKHVETAGPASAKKLVFGAG